MSLSRNNVIKEAVLMEASCHCTYRKLNGETSATAYKESDNTISATITWRHKGDGCSVLNVTLPIGDRESFLIPGDADVDAVQQRVFEAFLWHHGKWNS